jgi:fatty-acid desaturase
MTHNQIVRGLQLLNHLLLIVGLFAGDLSYLWVSLFFYWITGVFGINVGLHRLLSHRSFSTSKWKENVVSVIGVLTTVGSPLAWVAIHRQHHRSAETVKDPHSPYQIGNFRAWFGLWNRVRIDLKLVRDMRKDKFQKFLHKNYLAIISVYCLILFLIDPWLVIFAYAIPACLCLHSTSAIIVIAHRHGYRPYPDVKDQSRNSWIANLITLGEGWHNTHHAKPWLWNNKEKWWEFDLPAFFIKHWFIDKNASR